MTSSSLGHESTVLLERNVRRFMRTPSSIVSAYLIPSVFMVVLTAVFGRSVQHRGIEYIQFLAPASMTSAVIFAAAGSAAAIADDAQSGISDRFRAMPLARMAPVTARTGFDLLRAATSALVVLIVAVAMGFRFHGAWTGPLLFAVVLAAFATAASLAFDTVSLRARTLAAATSIIQFLTMPLILFSNSFVPVDTMPGWVQPIIDAMPASVVITALRRAADGEPVGGALLAVAAWLVPLTVLGVWAAAATVRRGRS